MEHRPLIFDKSSHKVTNSNIPKRLTYSNAASILLYTVILGLAVYFAYPYFIHNKHGNFNPARAATVIESNGYSAEARKDLIENLPNLEHEQSFNMFSGYLTAADENREIFYWFEESKSKPNEDPLIFWTNGGPGCSGLLGLLTENGAYWVYEDLSLKVNKYSWNNFANVVYIEQPYGVGFSKVDNGDTYVTGDDNAINDIDAVIRSFLDKYPKYQDNDIYLSGESYAGHYVPLTAKKVLENNDDGAEPYVNLKGFLVGNPLSAYASNADGWMAALYGHGIINKKLMDRWDNNCKGDEKAIEESTTCDVLYVKSYYTAYDVDVYALDFPTCTSSSDDSSSSKRSDVINERQLLHNQMKKRAKNLMEKEELLKEHFEGDMEQLSAFTDEVTDFIESDDGVPYLSCATHYLVDYLNLDDVQEALHVKEMTHDWYYCNDKIFEDWPESDWLTSMKHTYLSLINDYDIKMLIYSGDDDSVCSTQGTMEFLSTLSLDVDKDYEWKEWRIDEQVAGFYTKYLDSDGNSALHFQTVRSAGHMVPTTQPQRALKVLERFFEFYE